LLPDDDLIRPHPTRPGADADPGPTLGDLPVNTLIMQEFYRDDRVPSYDLVDYARDDDGDDDDDEDVDEDDDEDDEGEGDEGEGEKRSV